MSAIAAEGTPDLQALGDPSARVVFFPVRHHSPACARLVRELALRMKPAAVLIEGPSDFNDRLDELFLPHRLPIAIYSFVRLPDDSRRGAYYPFCVYSPEWQALQTARELGAAVRFIDLPWAEIASDEEQANRYADGELRRAAYVKALCGELQVENFDALWDTMFELDAGLTPESFLRRGHHFCAHTRLLENVVRETDRQREQFMAAQIRQAMLEFVGRILVVTGGYHSLALHAQLNESSTSPPQASVPREGEERGISLTPYSYERLDSLGGYDAGMPNPGFYHEMWTAAQDISRAGYRALLGKTAELLRTRKQPVSAADLIAVDTCAQSLAALRGHGAVWRLDLLDAITGALIKDDLVHSGKHPFLEAVHEVFRGGERGRLAEGTRLPPLVRDIANHLNAHNFTPEPAAREVEVDLATVTGLEQSRVLHRLRILDIGGFKQVSGVDFTTRRDLSHLREGWEIGWTPEFDARTVEASRYGPSLGEATGGRLMELSLSTERDSEKAALLLVDASLAGLEVLATEFHERTIEAIRSESDFIRASKALGHLLYLFRYDAVLGTKDRPDLGALVREAFLRSVWLLETFGQISGRDGDLLDGVGTLLQTFERCAIDLALDREEFVAALTRVQSDPHALPVVRGAAVGTLWTINAAEAGQVLAEMRFFSDPLKLGDFLAGLFALARETAQHDRGLLQALKELIAGYSEEDFLVALPSLRLAFTFFTPREKHHMATNLFGAARATERIAALRVSPEEAAAALAFEAKLFEAARRYGLRELQPQPEPEP